MDIQTLTLFFQWCSIINISLLVFWSLFVIGAPNWVYRTQSMFLPITRETFNITIYCFLGAFKFLVIVFNVVPYIALRIIG